MIYTTSVCVVSAFSKDPPLFLIKILQLKIFSMEILQKYSLQKLVILKKFLILVLRKKYSVNMFWKLTMGLWDHDFSDAVLTSGPTD